MRPTAALADLLTAALVAAAALPAAAQRPGLRVLESAHSYSTLVDRLTQAVKDHEMYLVNRASASAGAANRDIQIPGNMVVGVFRNDYALRMLEASVAAGYEAPIRFYVTESPDGTATLRYQRPSAAFAPYDDGGAALDQLGRELDAVFRSIAEQAVQVE
ncbi:DUF302 domain-containing protein [Rhodovibrio sodomensis]|nr:DUF302 domain-containing protein [Rhodovibrio sodomensis]